MAGKKGSRGGGLLEGLTSLVEKLGELADKSDQLKQSGEFTSPDKRIKGMYGVHVRTAGGGEDPSSESPRVEPFGNIGRDERAAKAVVQPIREPPVDLFEEGSDVLVVAELPGVNRNEIDLELRDDVLTLHAEHDELKYHKEVLLPRSYSRRQMHTSYRNGVLEIRFTGEEKSQS